MPSSAKPGKKKRHVARPDVRTKLLDAAEAVVREEGYGAATVRRIASRAGMTHQAVFYYFGSQEDLLLALIRRSTEVHFKRLHEALESEYPLREVWNLASDQDATRIGLEFMALANHSEVIRAQLASNLSRIRALEAEAVQRDLDRRGIEPRISPVLVSMLTNALARMLVQEDALGISDGHAEAEALVFQSLAEFEASGTYSEEVSPVVDAITARD